MTGRRDERGSGDLFGGPAAVDTRHDPAGRRGRSAPPRTQPLADRLRPASLDEVVGQDHLLGPDGALRRMLDRGTLASLI
ncbi:MAG: replication-associated recombination protein A, partial [Gluconacetobacter sp.]